MRFGRGFGFEVGFGVRFGLPSGVGLDPGAVLVAGLVDGAVCLLLGGVLAERVLGDGFVQLRAGVVVPGAIERDFGVGDGDGAGSGFPPAALSAWTRAVCSALIWAHHAASTCAVSWSGVRAVATIPGSLPQPACEPPGTAPAGSRGPHTP